MKLGDGVWRTIDGRHIFIQEGESLSSAMKRSGKFKNVQERKGRKRRKRDEDNKTNINKSYTTDEMRHIRANQVASHEYHKDFDKRLEKANTYEDRQALLKEYREVIGHEPSSRRERILNARDNKEIKAARNYDKSLEETKKAFRERERYSKEPDQFAKERLSEKKYKRYQELTKNWNEKGNKSATALNKYNELRGRKITPYKKAFEDYKRLHPNSKLNFRQFVKMSGGK